MTPASNYLEAVLKVAQKYNYEQKHSLQVARLALLLFDQLKELHGQGDQERSFLETAGILHDIGWIEGREGHHKRARDMIIGSTDLPFDQRQRIMIGLITRYHRRALPDKTQRFYADLNPGDQQTVKYLAALLRLADGLDRQHISLVEDLTCEIQIAQVLVRITARKFTEFEKEISQKKGNLFEQVFNRKLEIISSPKPPPPK